MYYYYFADMESLRPKVREAMEDIFLILQGKWGFDEDEEETEKMLEMFKNPEDILSEIVSIKEIDVSSKRSLSILDLTEEEKRQGILENPEEWVADMKDENRGIFTYWNSGPDFSAMETLEKIKVLAKFVLKMAVYRFCTMHFPKIANDFEQYEEVDIEPLENDLDEWEKQFWTAWVSHSVEEDFVGYYTIAKRRGELRRQYSRRTLKRDSREERDMWNDCIVRAFKDIDTVENVKKLREDCMAGKLPGKEKVNHPNYRESTDIQYMKHLLDMIDRHRRDELTSEDVKELKENSERWKNDLEKLAEMIHLFNRDISQ